MTLKILYILITFQLVINQLFGIGSIYYILGAFLFITELYRFDIKKKINKRLFPFLIFFLYSFSLLIINLLIEFSFDKIIMFISLFWIPVLLFFKANNDIIRLSSFLKIHTLIAIIGALGGIIEFHISRDIFGLVPKVGFLELYDNFELFYRTRSIFFSGQINALFMALSVILLLEFKIIENKYFKILVIFLFIYSLILTGSRIAFFIPFLYLFLKFPFKSILIFVPSIFIFFLYFFISDSNGISESLSRQFDILVNFNEFLSGDANTSRISKQLEAIKSSNLIIGNGMGSTYSDSSDYINTESYYVQIFSELGLIGLILLITTFVTLFRYSIPKLKIIIFVMFSSGIIVHGLSSPYLLIFWIILFNDENTI